MVAPTGSLIINGVRVDARPALSTQSAAQGVLQLAGTRIQLPTFPAMTPTMLPMPNNVNAYASMVGSALEVAGGDAKAKLAGAAALIGAAAPFAGPYAPALLVGATALSMVGGMFSSNPAPDQPKIKGIKTSDLLKHSFADVTQAVLLGKILSGTVQVDTSEAYKLTAQVGFNEILRVGPRHPNYRAAAFFAVYAGYDKLFDMNFTAPSLMPKLGALMAWGAPRVQIREALMYYNVAVLAKQRPLRLARAMVDTVPVPTPTPAAPLGDAQISNYADTDPTTFATLAMARAMPVPTFGKETKTWVYTPIPINVLKTELMWYETGRHPIEDTPTDKIGHVILRYKPDHGSTMYTVPITYAEAWRNIIALAHTPLAGGSVLWVDHVASWIREAKSNTMSAQGASAVDRAAKVRRQLAAIAARNKGAKSVVAGLTLLGGAAALLALL